MKKLKSLFLVIMSFLLTCLSWEVAAQDFSLMWDINRLSRTNSPTVELKNKNEHVLKRVPSNRLKTISRVFSDISEVSELNARLVLIQGDQPNAFAGPIDNKNTVGINFAMLDMLESNSSQWAAVLGHEMAHLKLDHYSAGLQRKIPIKIISAILRAKTNHYETIRDSEIVMKLIDTKFSRDQERQSDYLGAIWSVESGYNVWGAVHAHEKLRSHNKSITIPFLRSHPTGRERVKTLTELAERLSGSGVD
jgi:predicted Zn-dependent protease